MSIEALKKAHALARDCHQAALRLQNAIVLEAARLLAEDEDSMVAAYEVSESISDPPTEKQLQDVRLNARHRIEATRAFLTQDVPDMVLRGQVRLLGQRLPLLPQVADWVDRFDASDTSTHPSKAESGEIRALLGPMLDQHEIAFDDSIREGLTGWLAGRRDRIVAHARSKLKAETSSDSEPLDPEVLAFTIEGDDPHQGLLEASEDIRESELENWEWQVESWTDLVTSVRSLLEGGTPTRDDLPRESVRQNPTGFPNIAYSQAFLDSLKPDLEQLEQGLESLPDLRKVLGLD